MANIWHSTSYLALSKDSTEKWEVPSLSFSDWSKQLIILSLFHSVHVVHCVIKCLSSKTPTFSYSKNLSLIVYISVLKLKILFWDSCRFTSTCKKIQPSSPIETPSKTIVQYRKYIYIFTLTSPLTYQVSHFMCAYACFCTSLRY